MSGDVLIVYASKNGSTKEIAEKIGQTITDAGVSVDVMPVNDVGDTTPYKAIVIGSAIYIGLWRKEAVKFVLDNEAALSKKPLWIFSSGDTGTDPDQTGFIDNGVLPKKLIEPAARIKPRDIVVFKGYVNMDKVDFISRSIIRKIHAKEESNTDQGIGDYRDWDNITAWAKTIAASIIS
jgi:menaquinone-dependent protoporphyrinogen oxidase